MKLFKNKKGGTLENVVISVLMFSLVIVVFYFIPNEQGFWNNYGYTPPDNDITRFDKSINISRTVTDTVCDVNPEDESCTNTNRNLISTIEQKVTGAYGGLITIYKSFGIIKIIVWDVGAELGIPIRIIDIFAAAILALISITIILIIFNRSDT